MASLVVHASISLILHLLLIFAGDFYDQEIAGEGPFYTDIDYHVVTDAAEHVLKNASPYRRTTYRYTPLLAYLLTPNLWLDPRWGKFLFSIANVFVGLLIGFILKAEDRFYALCWLYNPMSAVIATRGSYESIVAMLVLALVYQIKQENRRTWITGVRMKLFSLTSLTVFSRFFWLYRFILKSIRSSILSLCSSLSMKVFHFV